VHILDATCPRVKKAQLLIEEQAGQGRRLLLYGEEEHPEVRGLLSYAGEGAFVFDTRQKLDEFRFEPGVRYSLAAQTTQDKEMFNRIAEDLRARPGCDVKVLETICDATRLRQEEAVNIARTFNDSIAFSGVILTKLDGDARGGAALSVYHVTGKSIKFVGMGEKIADLQLFHPDRMAERILGMGDVLSLIEQAETQMDQKKAEQLARHIKKNQFTMQDFLEQLEEMRKLGPLSGILEKLPLKLPLKKKITGDVDVDEQDLTKTLAVLRSMTLEERLNASIIGGSRKKRIARGSGTHVRDVNRVLSRFKESKKAIKLLSSRRGGKGRSPIDLMGM